MTDWTPNTPGKCLYFIVGIIVNLVICGAGLFLLYLLIRGAISTFGG